MNSISIDFYFISNTTNEFPKKKTTNQLKEEYTNDTNRRINWNNLRLASNLWA